MNLFKNLKSIILYFLGALLIYWMTLDNFFVSDDFDWILIGRDGSWWRPFIGNYFGQHGLGGSFRPLVAVLFKSIYAISSAPIAFHLVQVFFYALSAWLIWKLITLYSSNFSKIGLVASVVYLIMPHHVEAVAWIAGIADPIVVSCFLGSLYLYLKFDREYSNWSYFFALILFGLGLGFKESILTLPLVLFGYEFILKRNFNIFKIFYRQIWFYLLAVGYLVYRKWAIGLVAGYYGREQLLLRPMEWLKMLINLDVINFIFGQTRILVIDWLMQYWFLYLGALIIALLILLYNFIKNKSGEIVFIVYSWLSTCTIVLPLGISNLNDEGERYALMPSIFVAILIGIIIYNLYEIVKLNLIKKILFSLVVLILVGYYSYFNIQKQLAWNSASNKTQEIIESGLGLDFGGYKKIYFVGLPDNYQGAPILRNGIIQAFELHNITLNAERVPVNLLLNSSALNSKDKIYQEYKVLPDGTHFVVKDNNFIVTGNATTTTPEYYFELWNYNYDTNLANTIHLTFRNGREFDWARQEIGVVYYDENKLKLWN